MEIRTLKWKGEENNVRFEEFKDIIFKTFQQGVILNWLLPLDFPSTDSLTLLEQHMSYMFIIYLMKKRLKKKKKKGLKNIPRFDNGKNTICLSDDIAETIMDTSRYLINSSGSRRSKVDQDRIPCQIYIVDQKQMDGQICLFMFCVVHWVLGKVFEKSL